MIFQNVESDMKISKTSHFYLTKCGGDEIKGSYHEITKWLILLVLGWPKEPKGKFIWVIQQQSTVMSSLKLELFLLFLEKASGSNIIRPKASNILITGK